MTERLMRFAFGGFLLVHSIFLRAQPEDWVVVPSAYEFSMTVTYTISINGLVGAGPENIAAVFDDNGNCRGLGTTDFLASNGYYTGLMLVYGNQTTESGLEVRIWDATLDSLPECDDTVDFIANGISGSLSNPIVFYGVYDPLVGCTDPLACNYLSTAVTDDGSCIFPGCDDPLACNYVENSPCYDNSICTFPEQFLDCTGECLSDFDGDGICDELEIGGCTDNRACNYDSSATDDDCSCEFPIYPIDCNGNCFIDTDNDGVCEGDEIEGCQNPDACNYSQEATNDDESCEFCCFGIYNEGDGFSLEVELFYEPGSDDSLLSAYSTYRLYITCSHPEDRVIGVFGIDGNTTSIGSLSGFYHNPEAGLTIADSDSALFTTEEAIYRDSWITIGAEHPWEIQDDILDIQGGMWDDLFESGQYLFLGGSSGNGWSLNPNNALCAAGSDLRVLIGQFTTTDPIEGQIACSVIPHGSQSEILITPFFVAPPCGCSDPSACNFTPFAIFNDGSCVYPIQGETCTGNCAFDSDNDGVCDNDEIQGCTDFNADNFNPNATDNNGTCIFGGCTYLDAVNFDSQANVDDGSCQFDLFNPCPTDIDQDGITASSDILALLASFGAPCN